MKRFSPEFMLLQKAVINLTLLGASLRSYAVGNYIGAFYFLALIFILTLKINK